MEWSVSQKGQIFLDRMRAAHVSVEIDRYHITKTKSRMVSPSCLATNAMLPKLELAYKQFLGDNQSAAPRREAAIVAHEHAAQLARLAGPGRCT